MQATTRSSSRRGRGFAHPVLLGGAVVLAPILWVAFVASTGVHELLVGMVACAATVVFSLVVGRSTGIALVLRPGDLAQAWRIPWYLVSGVCEITVVLLKDVVGLAPAKNLYRVCGFDSSRHDPVRAARSVMAVAYTTTAPNFIVVDIDPDQSRMLFHQVDRSSVPRMAKALGARG